MAVHTEPHLEAVTLESVHFLHRTVAFLAGNFFPYVPLMIEQYVLRNVVYFLPRGGRFVVEIPVLFLNPGMIGNDVLVTVQTLFHRRYSRKIGGARVWMTIETLDLFYADMQLMAERNRLLGADVGGVIIEKIEKQHGSKGRQEG
jgi:hypothetical protein